MSSVAELEPARPPAVRTAVMPTPFRRVWRWHFFAGVAVAPVLVVLAVTGGLYVFKDELEPVFYPSLMTAPVAPSAARLQDQVAAATAAHPDCRPTRVELSPDPGRTTEVRLEPKAAGGEGGMHQHRAMRVFVDPGTAAVTGSLADDESAFRVLLAIHRRLFLGTTGRVFTELATCWTIVLLFTGLYLWMPRPGTSGKGVFFPRLWAKPYTVLRDLHAVAGLYLLPVALTIACTGLMYTWVWGSVYRTATAGDAPNPLTAVPKCDVPKGAKPVPVDAAVAAARARYPDAPLSVRLPQKPTDAYMVRVEGTTGPVTRAVVAVDRFTGAEIAHTPIEEFPAGRQVSSWALALHMGHFLGTPTKVLWVLACGVLAGLPVTGLWMWWQRRPRGRTGFPRATNARLPWWLWGGIVAVAVVLPVVGASLLVVLGLEAVWAWAAKEKAAG